MSVRKGPTRIPTFGSRIPLPGQQHSNASSTTTTPSNETVRLLDRSPVRDGPNRALCKSDVGRKVRVNDKEGALRYVGPVHFAAGTWCGVEVSKGLGKNDGSVRGVRYFACPKTCGLMAPLSKVTAAEDPSDDRSSGPYSMLFGIGDTTTIIRSRTFDKIESPPPDPNSTYDKINDATYEKLDPNDVTVVKDVDLNDTYVPKRNLILENLIDYNSPTAAGFVQGKINNYSTPNNKLATQSPLAHIVDEEINKRDSLEFEESLGILTPDQMIDVTTGLVGSRTPSSENIRLFPQDELSPKLESSIKEFSLGLIDEHIISALTMRTDAMNLPLDCKVLARIEHTPSPEELPLDPTPVADGKADNKKPPSSFITSITSITSLDTGYQGDGEMSRPASRGADNSPLTRRPQPRPPPRRPDPMTDSDFYTESDADNHEDHPLRGDRKAQVIDGTLYGVDPQAAADIYANNRENMDSSGIFTDIERADDLSSADNNPEELSPSDSSTKTISDDSQNNINMLTTKTPTNEPKKTETPPPPITPSPNSTVASSPASARSPRHLPKTKEDPKKYKMPKRNVASKVKAMIEPCNKENEKKPTLAVKKNVGRWDAVMNKISKGPQEIKNLKEVKSKVFTTIGTNIQRNDSGNKLNSPSQKSPSNKLRRVRTRAANNTTPNKNTGSINSSLSDLSGASPAKINGSAKKQRDVVRVTQVLTAAKLSPKANNHSVNSTEAAKNKSNAGHINHDAKSINRNLFNGKDKKKDPTKEIGRGTVKGGRVSPGTRPHAQPRAPLKPPAPRTAEALAVLVQHLVFNLEAFKNPSLKKEVERMRLDAEEVRLSCKQLEETLGEERKRHLDVVKDERSKYRAEITQLIERHRNEIIQLNLQHEESMKMLENEKDNIKAAMMRQHEDQMRVLKIEIDKLQQTHEESLDILREENDAIREQIDDKNARIRELEVHHRCESEKLRKDYEAKEFGYKEQLDVVREDMARLRAENEAIFASRCTGGGENSYQEVQSLRAVLELKQRDFAELRKALAEATQKADLLPAAEEKIAVLLAKCEDMQHQLERKNEYEIQLLSENKKLQESFKEEANQKKRLSQYNEELQWKLQQNKEVVTKVLEEAEASALTRSMLSASFNERHHSTIQRPNFERTLSFRERSLSTKSNVSQCSERSRKSKNSFEDLDDLSPPSSPKVKGVVEKSDSVSYVLEMDESPEVVASRIVRRSFRNATPPKNTPTKSPANKRARMKNNLSLSSSTSSIVPGIKTDHLRSRSASVRNGDDNNEDIFLWDTQPSSTPNAKKFEENYWSPHADFDEDLEDIKLPSLPSEIGNKHINTLPVPKHLAGEAMISESNSEDECSTSSSSGQL